MSTENLNTKDETLKDTAELLSKACGLYGYNATPESAAVIIQTYHKITQIGDQFSLDDAAWIEAKAKSLFPTEPEQDRSDPKP